MKTQNSILELIRDLKAAAVGADANGQAVWSRLFAGAAETVADLYRKSGAIWEDACPSSHEGFTIRIEGPLWDRMSEPDKKFCEGQGSSICECARLYAIGAGPAVGDTSGVQLAGGEYPPGCSRIPPAAIRASDGAPASLVQVQLHDGPVVSHLGWVLPQTDANLVAKGHGEDALRERERLRLYGMGVR